MEAKAPVPVPVEGGTCPVCGHPEDKHAYWSPDELEGGWAHCKVGSGDDGCMCWRDWPPTKTESAEPTRG